MQASHTGSGCWGVIVGAGEQGERVAAGVAMRERAPREVGRSESFCRQAWVIRVVGLSVCLLETPAAMLK